MFGINSDKASNKDEYIENIKEVTAGYAAGINWHSNGVGNDEYFAEVAKVLPKGKLDCNVEIMPQLICSLNCLISIVGDNTLDMSELTYQAIIDYIREHQDTLSDSTHTYRVILYLLDRDAVA